MKKLLIAFLFASSILITYAANYSHILSPNLIKDDSLDYSAVDLYHISTSGPRMANFSRVPDVSSSAITVAYNSSIVNVSVLDNQMVNLRIEDATGGIVYTKAFDSSNTHQLLIDVSDWDSGKYRIVFMNNTGEDSLYGFLDI